VKNNKIIPVQDSTSELENQSSRTIFSTSQSGFDSIIAGGIGLFSSCFAFGITALSLDVDKTFHESKNQTSFAKNLGDEGKYGFALAISASTFLTSFLIVRNYLKKNNRENNNQDGPQVSAHLVYSHGDSSRIEPSQNYEGPPSSNSIFRTVDQNEILIGGIARNGASP
jgi:hypothetical protein